MTGYEDISPEQIMILGYITTYCITVVVIGWIIRAFIQLKTARYIHLRIEKEIVAQVENEIFVKQPFMVTIKKWLEKKRLKKEDKKLGM